MDPQIVVGLETPDQIEQLLPYIDQVARPDISVVLLVHCNDRDSRLFSDQLRTFHTGFLPAPVFNDTSTPAYRLRAAEQRIFRACKSIRDRGVEIAVKSYSVPLRKVIKQYVRKGSVQMVVMHRNRRARPFMTLRRRLSSTFPEIDGVLLIQPNRNLKVQT